MANISLWGASYTDVPAVTLPKTGGGTATFTDVSGTTAMDYDVMKGKKYYAADGSESTGTFDMFELTVAELKALVEGEE